MTPQKKGSRKPTPVKTQNIEDSVVNAIMAQTLSTNKRQKMEPSLVPSNAKPAFSKKPPTPKSILKTPQPSPKPISKANVSKISPKPVAKIQMTESEVSSLFQKSNYSVKQPTGESVCLYALINKCLFGQKCKRKHVEVLPSFRHAKMCCIRHCFDMCTVPNCTKPHHVNCKAETVRIVN